MHYRMEIVLPNVADVESAISQILEPFCEHNEEDMHAFWDWYVIGGRWSGAKSEDIMSYKYVTDETKCERLIFAGPSHDGKAYEAKEMFQRDFWNGVSYVKTTWDGSFVTALSEFSEKLKGYRAEYAETITPKDDWLVVTVDYHS